MNSKQLTVRLAILEYMGSLIDGGHEQFDVVCARLIKNTHGRYPSACKRTIKKYFQQLIDQRALEPSLPVEYGNCYYGLSEKFKANSGWKEGALGGKHFYKHNDLAAFTGVRVMGIRNTAVVNNQVLTYGGVYYPEFVVDDSHVACARYVFQVLVPNFGYDEYGQWQQAYTPCTITAWNSVDSPNGKGLADILAKTVSPGKELYFQANICPYQGKIFKNGKWTGKIEERVVFVVIPGTLILGNDSYKTLETEIKNYYPGKRDFNSRPDGWDLIGSLTHMEWKEISNFRMSQLFKGGKTYGYAKVANHPKDGTLS